MNKELLDQLSAEERPVAEKLSSAADTMKLSQGFQWNLETRLMDSYNSITHKNKPMKIMAPVGWAVAAVIAVLLISWGLRTLLPGIQPAAAPTATQDISFEENVRQGDICAGPLAVGHHFAVYLTNVDKTGFLPLDPEKRIGELRSFAWSADGRLAILGNTFGSGNIYITDPAGGQLEFLLSSSELGYLWDFAWSRDEEQFVTWSGQNNKLLYVLGAGSSGPIERQLDQHILGKLQFTPEGTGIVFYGADTNAAGLFELMLDGSQAKLISPSVEAESGFAFSPDGSQLAYMEFDRDDGEARLLTLDRTTGEVSILGTLPIPSGSGSSLPEAANMSWSPDGKQLVFELGRGEADRAVYLANTDGTGLLKVVDSGHAPAISGDGKCLAYISDKQLFLLDFSNISSAAPLLLADLPTGRAIATFELDRLQWSP